MAMGAERRRLADALLVAAEAGDVAGVSRALGRGEVGPRRAQLLESLLRGGSVRGRPPLASGGWDLAARAAAGKGCAPVDTGSSGAAQSRPAGDHAAATAPEGSRIAGPTTAAVRGFPGPDEPRGLGGFAPLHYACRRGRWEATWLLLAAGANGGLPARSFDGRGGGETPLQLAAEAGDALSVGLLVASGASVFVANDDGATPLHAAAQAGNHLAVVELLASGADPLARDRLGDTPLEAASPLGPAPAARRIGRDLGAAEAAAAGAGADAVRAEGAWGGAASLMGLPLALLARVGSFLAQADVGAMAVSCRRLAQVRDLCAPPLVGERVTTAEAGGAGVGPSGEAGGLGGDGAGAAARGGRTAEPASAEPLPPGGVGTWEAALQAELGFGEEFGDSDGVPRAAVTSLGAGIAGSSRRRLQRASKR